MKNRILVLAAGLALLAGCGGGAKAPAAPGATDALKTDEEKTLYAMGVMLGPNVTTMGLTEEQASSLARGVKDAALGKPTLADPKTMGTQIQEFVRNRAAANAEAEKKKSAAFLEAAEKETGAVKTASGLIYIPQSPGKGASPKLTDTVKVDYEGSLIDGTVFDSSKQRGQPVEFGLTGVISCWTEGLQKMKVGEKAKLVCPSSIAYGDQGRPPRIPGGATLVFQVELLEIKPPQK